ncbi:fumarylacetoacetate hydrolase family protein [Phaeobacter sp. HF9A]|uniref:fumarylacetoacetate hydrolase family protein n=1 Tax=Phaeobacter sp. HF9A TaxID=2721561 RepID=UPI00143145C1|nr:fumarylacetoacetate hydrolase family protein [Phaeobacter sp. HF9A]NIZ12510.1 hypothetical protein [Phaeobacter sp. HF9A]
MRKLLMTAAILLAATYAAVLSLLALPDWNFPRQEAPRLVDQTLADPEDALTFAFTSGNSDAQAQRRLLLVTEIGLDNVFAIDLSPHLPPGSHDAFDAVDILGWADLVQMASQGASDFFPIDSLLPVAEGEAHVAFGTNFQSHGKEVENEAPFAFPRLTRPSAAMTELAVDSQAVLLDYEVELCMRFDRDIAVLGDFEAARKAIFLCGDFTDRAALLRGMPEGEKTFSGIGFTDAKSLPGAFPTGPVLVIPRDWRSFVKEEYIATELNGQPMQFASGADMQLDFGQMADFTLQRAGADDWVHQGSAIPLIPGRVIRKGQVLLSGTPEGVLLRRPSRRTILANVGSYLLLGGAFSGRSPYRYILENFIQSGLREGAMLQPGDTVVHRATRLGTIKTQIKEKGTTG